MARGYIACARTKEQLVRPKFHRVHGPTRHGPASGVLSPLPLKLLSQPAHSGPAL
jgi:hypothetical protein